MALWQDSSTWHGQHLGKPLGAGRSNRVFSAASFTGIGVFGSE